MPSFEELPDDYGTQAPSSETSAAASEVPRSSGSADGAVKRGFLNRGGARPKEVAASPIRDAATKADASVPQKPAAACGASSDARVGERESSVARAAGCTASPVSADASRADAGRVSDSDGEDVDAEFNADFEVGEEGDDGDAQLRSAVERIEGLRRRLRSVGADAQRAQEETAPAVEAAASELEGLLRSLSEQTKWPSAKLRSAREKAMVEADSALADMRVASNDARRLRTGEERRAASELRRTAEDTLERVKKAMDAAAPRGAADDQDAENRRAVEAFHALPALAKLRLLGGERVSLGILAACFGFGAVLVFGAFIELYTAWGCGLRCGR
eukprot:TRINITY_DN49320_c0_g1_i1.p1 TRINITY_DN49320_c0_g1~~TRINITY_DN49320_c0_g1_i1.p1  ORF type:complete len:346 (+),score=67.71 TRINITY_DN49320_c0_g1_i1:43-1038(+)